MKDMKVTFVYFSACSFIGYIADLIYPLRNSLQINRQNFAYHKIFNVYVSSPGWLRYALGAFLISFALISIYGRINMRFGSIVFSRIKQSRIRKDVSHIIKYTVIPVFVAMYYIVIFLTTEFG